MPSFHTNLFLILTTTCLTLFMIFMIMSLDMNTNPELNELPQPSRTLTAYISSAAFSGCRYRGTQTSSAP